ncbi:MAG: hypothetical protein BWX70_02282 [Verrucomicrobia bacterium ADurb.Bin070]|nr:MAG: hypothetical protein BWX70_02282 [Verrucomicrobia bacterium ADurb.Bin070]
MVHRARFVQIEINVQAVLAGARHQRAQSRDPLFAALAELREGGIFRQRTQHSVDPHAVHAGRRETLQQPLGIRGDFRIKERIAVLSKVRENKTQAEGGVVRRRRGGECGIRPREPIDKSEAWFFGFAQARRDALLAQPGGELFGCRAFRFRRRRVAQRRAGRLDAAELDEEEIILHQGVTQPLAREAGEGQKLVVGQQVPVAPHHRDIALVLPRRQDRALRRQPHGSRDLRHVFGCRGEDRGQSCLRHHAPVAPHELVQPAGERLASQRGFFARLVRKRRLRAVRGARRKDARRHDSCRPLSCHSQSPLIGRLAARSPRRAVRGRGSRSRW